MPFINGRYYANPAFGWGVELGRIIAGHEGHNSGGNGDAYDASDHSIIGDVPSLSIYSSPQLGETESSDQASGFCDLTIRSLPHGVKCEQGKDYHGTAVLVIAGVGTGFHYVDPNSIRVAAEADSDIVSVEGRPVSTLGGHQQWTVNFTIKSGPGFKQQGGGILWDHSIQMYGQGSGKAASSNSPLPMTPRAVLRTRRCLLFLLFALIASPSFAQGRYPRTALCFVRNLPTEVPSDFREIGVERQFFAADSSSTAELRIRNLSPKPIIAVQLVLEYYGASGERFGDAIAQAIAKEVPAEQMFAIGKRMDGGGADEISNLVRPGDTASVVGGGLFATATCPARAKLTAALLWFSDGTSVDWSAPDSRVDPESDEIPLAKLPACLVEHNIDRLFLVLDLDDRGRVLKVSGFPPDASQPEPCDLRELGDWKFQPALLGGKPVATKLNLLLRLFERDKAKEAGDLPVSRREALHPVTVVDAFAPVPGKSGWWLFYGSMIPQPPESR